MHRLNLHLSANSSLVISLPIFLFLKWPLCRWRFESDLRKSLLETFLCPALISHSSLTPVFHTEWQSTKLLAHFSQAHPHTDKKSFREYRKCTDYFETRYIKCGVLWEHCILFTLAAGLTVQVLFPINTSLHHHETFAWHSSIVLWIF